MRLNFPPFAGWMGGDKEFGESEAATQLARTCHADAPAKRLRLARRSEKSPLPTLPRKRERESTAVH